MTNPLLTPSTLPYQLPNFAAITPEHYLPAIEQGLEEARAAYAQLAENTEEPSFENVIEVLENPSATLHRAVTIFYNITSADGTDQLLELEAQVTEKLTQLGNELHLNPAVFSKLDAVYQKRHQLGLTAEQLRLTEKFHQQFTLAGAALKDEERHQLAELNLQIAQLQTEFGQQVTRDLNAAAVLVEDETQLEGLSQA
ncbi:MAG: M3 family peptidase, partial [Rothia sp. (in: high G+C Gram-positive bacteria)]|nr:M3 family peptidase [Rothia sp. (in: high G+C Gram-positive bacteria)]